MINSLFLQPNYLAAKKLLDATAMRHEAIASNLANIETPHYRRVDVNPSFMAELKQALAAGDPARLTNLNPRIAVDGNAVSSRRDGNTVELDAELIALNQNSVAHALETQLVSSALLKMRTAITGRSTV